MSARTLEAADRTRELVRQMLRHVLWNDKIVFTDSAESGAFGDMMPLTMTLPAAVPTKTTKSCFSIFSWTI